MYIYIYINHRVYETATRPRPFAPGGSGKTGPETLLNHGNYKRLMYTLLALLICSTHPPAQERRG